MGLGVVARIAARFSRVGLVFCPSRQGDNTLIIEADRGFSRSGGNWPLAEIVEFAKLWAAGKSARFYFLPFPRPFKHFLVAGGSLR